MPGTDRQPSSFLGLVAERRDHRVDQHRVRHRRRVPDSAGCVPGPKITTCNDTPTCGAASPAIERAHGRACPRPSSAASSDRWVRHQRRLLAAAGRPCAALRGSPLPFLLSAPRSPAARAGSPMLRWPRQSRIARNMPSLLNSITTWPAGSIAITPPSAAADARLLHHHLARGAAATSRGRRPARRCRARRPRG